MKRFRLSLKQRDNVIGLLFILPFIIGFFLFILTPVIQSIVLSINDVQVTKSGFETSYIGFKNYSYATRVNTEFVRQLVEILGLMLLNVFWIIVFSFFAALLLNQKFRGRLLFRVIFFLPVVMAAGVIIQLEMEDYMMGVIGDQVQQTYSFISYTSLSNFLMQLQISEGFVDSIVSAVENIPAIVNAAGIQILIFLAGLQSITPSLYEAAQVEGATAWENFWLITFPMVSPLIMTNMVYTVIDFFVSPSNSLVQLIRNTAVHGAGFGVSAAMSWIYFLAIGAVLAITFLLLNRLVFYHE